MNSIDALTDTAFGRGSACAKAILIGEHTVLYHQPAIAIPLPTLTVTAVAHVSATVSNDDASGIPTSTTDGPIDIDFACGAATSGSQGTSAPLRADGALAAIAAASRLLGIRRRKTWIQISGNFPPARGLGFSAACAAAAIRSVADAAGERFDADTLFDLVQCGEQRTHGRASGVDAATVTSTQPILFHSGAMRPLNTDTEAVVVLADSGA
ncbi:mevalonate kinase family protein, partial [Nocardia pseudobrasiliensis]